MQGGHGGSAAGGQLADREFVDSFRYLGHLATLPTPSGARSVDRGCAEHHAKQSLSRSTP
ncbi:hypothetical protein GCM10010358_56300 [Streptomyces minutiscleroticus]|uniref:Uncharacterized protein n=1 Tax=Streptomyces minutiscleroticus TaxID=68238 RepID=A0A918U512_9ACTN|nr:hypothetical protein GCM10010358_56300 [Streptomyces minutiscleroticus]